MARTKQATPLRRDPSSEYISKASMGTPSRSVRNLDMESRNISATNGHTTESIIKSLAPEAHIKKEASTLNLLFAAGGIYGSFIIWGMLQEKISKISYGSGDSKEKFRYSIFQNTIQAFFSAISGYIYLLSCKRKGTKVPPIFPHWRIALYLLLTSITTSLASPFGYAALGHVDYITYLLAKSCKLLPVMFLHITLFQKRYPLYKYIVVLAVTSGVAIFTLHSSKSKSSGPQNGNVLWGILLLVVNLLFDGLTNVTQDYIFATFQPYTGPQMMCANNIMGVLLMGSYLLLSPYLVQTGIGEYLGMDLVSGGQGELKAALAFMGRHPEVWWDIIGFAVCGAVGQIFIFYTLSTFSSLFLVTITITRKMLSMICSILWFGHSLGGRQWAGVALVFGGIGAEGVINRQEKAQAAKKKAESAADAKRKEL